MTPDSMRRALRRYLGVQKFNQLVPQRVRTSKGEEYAKAFAQSRSERKYRAREIAKRYGMRPYAVRSTLLRYWGRERYQRETGKLASERLVVLLNKRRPSKHLIPTVARELGIKPESLRSKLSRWKIRRDREGRYVQFIK